MNSFNFLSVSSKLHSAAAILSLPIHCSAFSLFCLLNVQYCRYLIVSLCCGENLLFEVLNRPSTELYNSCYTCVSF